MGDLNSLPPVERLFFFEKNRNFWAPPGGPGGTRTLYLMYAKHALYQLSYGPKNGKTGALPIELTAQFP